MNNAWFLTFVFSMLVYSISNHFVYAHGPFHLYDKIRHLAETVHPQLGELFSCMICFPTWVGMSLSALNVLLLPSMFLTPMYIILGSSAPWWVIIALDGFFGSAVGWLIDTIQISLERSNQDNG